MPHLILVKHALPEIIPTLPANAWHLSEVGRTQCALLADQLPPMPQMLLSQAQSPKRSKLRTGLPRGCTRVFR
jgi:hypothetical protein